MKIALLEPFLAGSHKHWADSLVARSKHEIKLYGLPGNFWKWRMHGGAVSLARTYMADDFDADVFLVSDMIDLALFRTLTRDKTANKPFVLYFHENQLTYPSNALQGNPEVERDNHYAFVNFSSALAADRLLFNSQFHRENFLEALPVFLDQFPDFNLKEEVQGIREKSSVMPIGLDLKNMASPQPNKRFSDAPVILWNHRWEYDKNPEAFFDVLHHLTFEGYPFYLVLMGKKYRRSPAIFTKAMRVLANNILHVGYAEDRQAYQHWLWLSDLLPVTSNHDYFGVSVVEAINCGCLPLLPNRLAYPEHIPKALHEDFLYQDENELYDRLRMLIEQFPSLPMDKVRACKAHVYSYDWSTLIHRYDAYFEDLLP